MTDLRLVCTLTYNAEMMHGGDDDIEAKAWFFDLLAGDGLILHSQDIGDEIGTIRVQKIGGRDE
jgi:hypothetical protein